MTSLQSPELRTTPDIDLASRLKSGREHIITELRKRIIGQEGVIEQVLTALFAGGNCLIVGVPGLAKTLLIHTIAQALDLKFSRIQFTPDLMPSDITGTDLIQEDPARDDGSSSSCPGRSSPTSCSRTRSIARRRRRNRRCSRRCRSIASPFRDARTRSRSRSSSSRRRTPSSSREPIPFPRRSSTASCSRS